MKFLGVLVGLVTCPLLWGQVEWSRSDVLGNDWGPGSRGSSGWVLRIESRKGGEERTLFQDGKVQLVRLVDLDSQGKVLRIREIRDGAATWEVSYDPDTGLPLTETNFKDNRLFETATLVFKNRTLSRRSVMDSHGKLLYTDTLYRWPDGNLRRLERDGPDGPEAEVSWSYGTGGNLKGVWSVDSENRALGEHREWVYTDRRTDEVLAKGAEVLESRMTEWLEAGGSRVTGKAKDSDAVETKVVDSRGNLVSSVTMVKGTPTQSRKWFYDSTGRVTRESTEMAGITEIWTYLYNTDGTVAGALTRNGVKVREELLRDGETVRVKLYDRGDLFLIEDWDGGKLVKESYFSQGILVRERKR